MDDGFDIFGGVGNLDEELNLDVDTGVDDIDLHAVHDAETAAMLYRVAFFRTKYMMSMSVSQGDKPRIRFTFMRAVGDNTRKFDKSSTTRIDIDKNEALSLVWYIESELERPTAQHWKVTHDSQKAGSVGSTQALKILEVGLAKDQKSFGISLSAKKQDGSLESFVITFDSVQFKTFLYELKKALYYMEFGDIHGFTFNWI